ncbi:hypothetical protein R3P38DRAFT_2709953 [Favolaschia claudopus]|uniref:F-box domain-containing protein n=1 Tax=Favolaschia claudopus TaxID=2862362 RepID=A0AAW0BDM5_9AGAR
MLPQELVNVIVAEVEAKVDLEACSLTARSFVTPSQRALFRKKSLQWDSSSRIAPAFERALSLIEGHPHIAIHVRELTIDVPKFPASQSILAAVLRTMNNLERLGINGHAQDWDNLVPELKDAILNVISLPSLRRLHLLRISSLPISVLFHAASSVGVLSLNLVTPLVPRDISLNDGDNLNVQLGTLILPSCLTTPALLQVCDFFLRLQNLQRLSIQMQSSGHHRTIITSSSQSLVHLKLDCAAFLTPLDLPPLPNLQTLSLSLAKAVDNDRAHLPTNLSNTIASLPTHSPLLQRLDLTVCVPRVEMNPVWDPDSPPFPLFQQNDSSPSTSTSTSTSYKDQSALPCLRSIHCHLEYSEPSLDRTGMYFGRATTRFVEAMRAKFPAAHRDRILSVGRAERKSKIDYFEHLP